MALSKKQRAFVNAYLECWNASEAARRAGYSERSARSIGSENLTKPDIADEISARLTQHAMSADEALWRFAQKARVDLGDYIETAQPLSPYFKLKQLIDDGHGHIIRGLKPTQAGTVIEMHDSVDALKTILAHHSRPAKGTEEDPAFQVGMSLDEWRTKRDQRRAEVAATEALYDGAADE